MTLIAKVRTVTRLNRGDGKVARGGDLHEGGSFEVGRVLSV